MRTRKRWLQSLLPSRKSLVELFKSIGNPVKKIVKTMRAILSHKAGLYFGILIAFILCGAAAVVVSFIVIRNMLHKVLDSVETSPGTVSVIAVLLLLTALLLLFRKKAVYYGKKFADSGWKRILKGGIGIAIGVLGIWLLFQWSPWQSKKKENASQESPAYSTSEPAYAVNMAYSRPGPDLAWGENHLIAGHPYYFNRFSTFQTSLLSRWKEGMKLTCYKEGHEFTVYWEILFNPDKGTSFGENHDDQSSDGEFYLIPSHDMKVYIIRR